MGIKKYDKSFFDCMCEKYRILRDYIHYLPPQQIAMILLICTSNFTQKMICDELNKNKNNYREFTPSRLKDQISKIRIKLYAMQRHAILFGIEKKIKPLSIEQLDKIVREHAQEETENEND